MNIQAVFFDMGGTIDTYRYTRAWKEHLVSKNVYWPLVLIWGWVMNDYMKL